jgi:2-hydroxyacyl-CoA lyase 1
MSEVDGATLIARSLKHQGIDHLFGVVGFPVGPIAAAAQQEGINYIGMRNEQAASYAAQAYGYMTGRPGAATVTGPGVVNGLRLANARRLLAHDPVGGAPQRYRGGMGAPGRAQARSPRRFAISPVSGVPAPLLRRDAARPMGDPAPSPTCRMTSSRANELDKAVQVHVCLSRRAWRRGNVRRRWTALERASRSSSSASGRGVVRRGRVRAIRSAPRYRSVRSPMGKGVMPTTTRWRSRRRARWRCRQADVVLMGARFNWISFRRVAALDKDVKVIQLDIAPGRSATTGDGRARCR